MTSEKSVWEMEPALRTIGLIGVSVTTATLGLFVLLALVWPDPYVGVWQLLVSHMVMGGIGNVGYALELGFHPFFVLFQCTMQDYAILWVFYPLCILGYYKALHIRVIGPWLIRIHATASQHKKMVERFGILGLMSLVIFPVWNTGLLVGALIGYLMGMRRWVTFTAVMAANLIAVILWVFLFQQMTAISEHLAHWLLIAVFVGSVVSIVAMVVARVLSTRNATETE